MLKRVWWSVRGIGGHRATRRSSCRSLASSPRKDRDRRQCLSDFDVARSIARAERRRERPVPTHASADVINGTTQASAAMRKMCQYAQVVGHICLAPIVVKPILGSPKIYVLVQKSASDALLQTEHGQCYALRPKSFSVQF
ncbi:uncharacterized protein LOC142929607 [Petromyzon marinus]|uniref:uncharacterized protein LOC142929607 n=1 Tax=Petromyzon marinus TaxID=7757 RepID=UPI003F716743